MGRPKKPDHEKSTRMTFTINLEAAKVINSWPDMKKSALVCDAVVKYELLDNNPKKL